MKFYNSSRESLLCRFMQTSYGWGNIIAQVFSCPMTSLPMCHIDVTHTLDCNGHCIHFTNSHTDISKNNTTVHHHHLHLGILARFWSRPLCTCSIIFTTSAFAHFPSSLCVFLNSSWSSWCCIGFFCTQPNRTPLFQILTQLNQAQQMLALSTLLCICSHHFGIWRWVESLSHTVACT